VTEKIYFPPQPMIPPTQGRPEKTRGKGKGTSFAEILTKQSLKFSHHAQQRITSRKINLNAAHLQRINAAVEKAAAKGARDSLILIDNLAFIVSVKNRTVVTAMDGESVKGNVFTNIDSAVIV
jgi:flagellar operon protein